MLNGTDTPSNISNVPVHQYEYDDKDYSDYYDEPLYRLQDDVSSRFRRCLNIELNLLSDWRGGPAGRGLLRHLPHGGPRQLHRHLHRPHQPPHAGQAPQSLGINKFFRILCFILGILERILEY